MPREHDVRLSRVEVRRFGRQHVARLVRDAHILPGLALVLGQLDEAGVGANPDLPALHGRQRHRLNRAAHEQPGLAAQAVRRGHGVYGIAQVGRDLGPVRAAVDRRHHKLEGCDELARIPGRERERLRNRLAGVQPGIELRADIDPLLAWVADLEDADPARVHDVRVQRIRRFAAPFPAGHGIPVERRDGALVAT